MGETTAVIKQMNYSIEFAAFTESNFTNNVTSVVSAGTPIYMQAKFQDGTVDNRTKIGLKDCFVSPVINASNLTVAYHVLDNDGCLTNLAWDEAGARNLIMNSESKAQFMFKSFTWVKKTVRDSSENVCSLQSYDLCERRQRLYHYNAKEESSMRSI